MAVLGVPPGLGIGEWLLKVLRAQQCQESNPDLLHAKLVLSSEFSLQSKTQVF